MRISRKECCLLPGIVKWFVWKFTDGHIKQYRHLENIFFNIKLGFIDSGLFLIIFNLFILTTTYFFMCCWVQEKKCALYELNKCISIGLVLSVRQNTEILQGIRGSDKLFYIWLRNLSKEDKDTDAFLTESQNVRD